MRGQLEDVDGVGRRQRRDRRGQRWDEDSVQI